MLLGRRCTVRCIYTIRAMRCHDYCACCKGVKLLREKLPKGSWLKSHSLSTLTLLCEPSSRPLLQVTLAGKPFVQCAIGTGTFTYALVPAANNGLLLFCCFIHEYKVWFGRAVQIQDCCHICRSSTKKHFTSEIVYWMFWPLPLLPPLL